MIHDDHVALIRDGLDATNGTWADFGSGTGAFTLALADLLGPEGHIYSVDRDRHALRQQERSMTACFPATSITFVAADFLTPLVLPPLDGMVMANALHFHGDHVGVIRKVRPYLRAGGRLILVEYNTHRGNHWVPHPLTFTDWEAVALAAGYRKTRLLATRPSSFLGEIYAAVSE